LKSDQAEKTTRETTDEVERTANAIIETTARTEDAIKETTKAMLFTVHAIERTTMVLENSHYILAQQADQTKALSIFTVVATAFLPLSFCTSVCCSLSTRFGMF